MEVLSNARVDHLGLVAGFAKEMKLAERIDKLLGVYPDEKVTLALCAKISPAQESLEKSC